MRIDKSAERVIWSASDLKAAAECEFAWMRAIDAKLGRIAPVDETPNPTLERAARLGDVHEERVLAAYREQYGTEQVIEIERASSADAAALQDAVDTTIAALHSDATVVFQAAFATDEFVGFADFLFREDDGTWRVQDSKLARRAKSTALMQLAAYVDQLDRLGIARSDTVELILGNGESSEHAVRDVLPLFFVRRNRLRALIADRDVPAGSTAAPIAWGDTRGDLDVHACGRCDTCALEVEAHRDLLLVARMRPVQRTRLRADGILTIDDLAAAVHAPAGMNAETFRQLRSQARVQLATEQGDTVAVEAYNPQAVHSLPRPSQGDIFFDFEGDPLYSETHDGVQKEWGIDYLFGWVDNDEQYSAIWAHTFDEERQALEQFLTFVETRRHAHPDMHIYHYAPYETTHLTAMAARHGVGEAQVDALLRDGVFVDLYPLVLRTVRIGSPSYSIKKLEPLYMGEEIRTSDVQKGDDSIVQYVAARELASAGAKAEADGILNDLADYNRYDCVSTLRLRNWLIGIAREAGVQPAPPDEPEEYDHQPSLKAAALRTVGRELDHDKTDGSVFRLAAAALDYYPREAKSFWQAHFARLRQPVSMWDRSKDVVLIDPARSAVSDDWRTVGRGRVRDLELCGDIAPGTTLGVGSEPFAHYATPFAVQHSARDVSVAHRVTVAEVIDAGYRVTERPFTGEEPDALPIALTPASPPRVEALQRAIDEWADTVLAAAPNFPQDAATDILRRIPPRTRSGAALPPAGDDRISAIVAAVRDLDNSYLAVQGPPGTGKTYTASHVIARLVTEHGLRVGVVAQSHAIVETLLDRVIEAGVPAQVVAKKPKDASAETTFTPLARDGMAGFLSENAGRGVVVGGTAWDFSNTRRVERHALDLIVVDEAGQFSLANTIAVAAGTKNLMLLGDPQQLPQVSQGTHPEPVDTSALGWVMDGTAVISPDYGYFLAESWRMHPAVAHPVSELAYDDQLASAPGTENRAVDGVDPGLHTLAVRHRGNATESLEEAAAVVAIVRDLIGRTFTDNDASPDRPLEQADIIVVTPYNAQKAVVHQALQDAGYPDIPVGTVDNFQGKEAVVSITSLAASSGRDAPRGPEFLLLQNRLNVAISRAMCLAYLVYSPALLDDLPHTADGVARLSAFAHLIGADAAG